MRRASQRALDRGSILLIVLVVVVVLGAVVVAIASYTTSTLSYGQVVESRGDRLAASQAGMDDAIEQLALRQGLAICATGGGTGGVSKAFPEVINGSGVGVTCRLTAGSTPSAQGFALAVTGAGLTAPTTQLEFNNGDEPIVDGPVFVSNPDRIDLKHLTTIVEGDLWYPNAACADPTGTATKTVFERSSIAITNLAFNPSPSRGYYCVNKSWNELFVAPPIDAGFPSLGVAPPPTTVGSCTVWSPGRYTAPPALTPNNYFKSGVYNFENIGTLAFNKQVATFGNSLFPGFPVIDNSACDGPRGMDATTGATIYTSGDTQFYIDQNASGFEVAGKEQGGRPVAIHVISTTLNPNLKELMASGNGNGREVSLNGLLWAPNSALVFGTVPVKKAAALRGGAVVSRLVGKISGAASGFVIEVPSITSSSKFSLESTATNPGGATRVRVVADYRPSSGALAVNSRRVCGPTC